MSFEKWVIPYLKAWDRRWQMRKGLRDAYQAGQAEQKEKDAQELDSLGMDQAAIAIRTQ